jgi:hypothetical protein
MEVGGDDGGLPGLQRTGDGSAAPLLRPRTGDLRAGATPDATAAPPSGSPPPEMPIIQRSRAGRRPGGDVGLGEPITVARTLDGAATLPPSGITRAADPSPAGTGAPGGEMPLVQRSHDDPGALAAAHGPSRDGGDGPGGTSAGLPGSASAVASAEPPAGAVGTAVPPADGEAATATVRPTLGLDDPLTAAAAPDEATPGSEPPGDVAPSGPGATALPLATIQRQAIVDDPGTPGAPGTPAATTGDVAAVTEAADGAGSAAPALPSSPATDLATATVPGPGPGAGLVTPSPAATLPLVAQRSLAAGPTLASALAVRVDGGGRPPEPAAGGSVAVPVPTWSSPAGRSSASGRPVVQRWPSLDSVTEAGRDALGSAAGAARDRGRDVVESGLDRASDRLRDAAAGLPNVPSAGDLPPLDLANAPEMPSVADLPGLGDVPGLPSLPSVPGMPTMPSLPGMPAAPSLPSLPSMPLAMPSLPSMPSVPSVPSVPAIPPMPSMPAVTDLPGASALAGAAGVPMTEITFPAAGAAGAASAAAADAPAAGPGGAGGGAPGGGAAGGDLDELAHKLYDRIRWRLRTELRLDRERAGLGAGVRH